MQIKPTVAFRDIRHSASLERDIRARIHKLETYYDSIVTCRVLVELAEQHHRGGNRFHVRLDIVVPGKELVVSHEAGLRAGARSAHASRMPRTSEADPGRVDARVAIREAFEVARRELQDYARRQRGHIKTSATARLEL